MIDEKRNCLTHHFKTDKPIGQKLFSDLLTIRSRLNHPEIPAVSYGSAISMEGPSGQSHATSVFSEGLPVEEFDIVRNGVLQNVFYPLYWANLNHRRPLAFPTLIEFEGSGQSLDQIIGKTQKGLLINSFWYIRFVDPTNLLLTGLTRDGVFLIEDGKLAGPVKNLRFNESPLVSLGSIEETGICERRDTWGSSLLIPPMKIANFTFSVETDAI
jgi:predicted Zn-dependent protease